MWRRLSEPDIARAVDEHDRRRRRLWPPLLTGLLFGAAITLLSFGYRGGRTSSGVVFMGSERRLLDPRNVVVFALAVAILFTIAYLKQRRTGQWLISEAPSVICSRYGYMNNHATRPQNKRMQVTRFGIRNGRCGPRS
jgi:hypothetical protein